MMWSRKYKPTCQSEYVMTDTLQKLLNASAPRHLMLHGDPGTGKTTFAEIYAAKFGVERDSGDFIQVMPWQIRNIDDIRGVNTEKAKTVGFAATTKLAAWGREYRFFHLEECDDLTPIAQNSMKILIEEAPRTTIFILTTNNILAVNKALQSRCMKIGMQGTYEKMFEYAKRVLTAENIPFDNDKLYGIIKAGYPRDLRAGVDRLQLEFGDDL